MSVVFSFDIRNFKNTRWQEFYASVRNCLLKGELAGAEGPIFASGLSMGALLALLLAHEFKDRVSGVSCLAPTLFYDGWNIPISRFFLPLGYRTFLKHFFYFKEEPPYGIKNEMILLYDSYHVITADHERDTVARKMENFFGRIRRAQSLEHHGGIR